VLVPAQQKRLFSRDIHHANAQRWSRDMLRRALLVLLGIAVGYAFGYQDAYRGPSSLGWKIGELTDHLQPDAVRQERARNAERIRQRAREGLPLPE
jgi:hypothetical protein